MSMLTQSAAVANTVKRVAPGRNCFRNKQNYLMISSLHLEYTVSRHTSPAKLKWLVAGVKWGLLVQLKRTQRPDLFAAKRCQLG